MLMWVTVSKVLIVFDLRRRLLVAESMGKEIDQEPENLPHQSVTISKPQAKLQDAIGPSMGLGNKITPAFHLKISLLLLFTMRQNFLL